MELNEKKKKKTAKVSICLFVLEKKGVTYNSVVFLSQEVKLNLCFSVSVNGPVKSKSVMVVH